MITLLSDTGRVDDLFGGPHRGVMVLACLRGIMGSVFSPNDVESLQSALALLGDFAFLAGKPDPRLARWRPPAPVQAPAILVPMAAGWSQAIERAWGDGAVPITRYAFDRRDAVLDPDRLKALASTVPNGFELRQIDEEIYHRCLEAAWSRDFVSNYPDARDFERLGLGWVALRDGAVVAGASSYASCGDGIEIQVETDLPFRRMGLARACAAKLVLNCLDRGLYPSWDAANEASCALAGCLGYGAPLPYRAYSVSWRRS